VRTCHRLAARGFLFGGSTGTVVHGAMTWLADHRAQDVTAVAISPDLGRPYLDTIYDPDWVLDHFGAGALAEADSTTATTSMTASAATSSPRRLSK
jgi:N-(2-amino-2-carboxyethyl)-L-glutamate synthase